MNTEKKMYFSAGPAKLPADVMNTIHEELLDYRGTGISVLEMSHRSEEFNKIIMEAESDLRKLLEIPDDYSVLFMHGGAKMQFSAIPMNLCGAYDKVDYIVNGSWSKMAAAEAEKYTTVNKQLLKSVKFNRLPRKDELTDVSGSKYLYFCDNETIEGVEFNHLPEVDGDCVLVSDMTSNFLSRKIDVSKFGVIFAGAQKNCGIAGLTIVIIRKDLLGKQHALTPKLLNYKVLHEQRSLYNTPLTFNIYIAGICFRWALEQGGLDALDQFSKEKSGLLYNTIDDSKGFYVCPVEKSSRSRMNVVWLISNKDLDAIFAEESRKANLYDIQGHRSVGGFRASLYHGITLDMVKKLCQFMVDFKSKHS